MRNLAIAALTLLATAALAPATAIAAAEAVSVEQDQSAWAELARTVAPDTAMADGGETMLASLIQGMRADPGISKMESAFPGMLDAIGATLRPLVTQEARIAAPLYQADLTNFYRAHLTAEEAATVAHFVQSPAMTHFSAEIAKNRSAASMSRDALAGADISKESFKADLNFSATNALLQLESGEVHEIKAFFATPLGIKFQSLNAKKIEIDTKWTNYISPEAEAKIEPLMIATMADHIARTDPATAEEFRKIMAQELAKPGQ